MAGENTIILKGRGVRKEGSAAAAITPGDLIERTSTAGEIQRHSTAGGNAAPSFAVENELVGNGIDVDYAANDNVLFEHCERGGEVQASVAAGAAAIVAGDYLESAGDGTLQKVATSASTSQADRAGVIARALEAVDNSGGGSKVRINVEIL